jgi:transcriptional regulator
LLIRKLDAALNDDEWRTFLRDHDFGQFIASGRNRDVPVIVPTHFVFEGAETILFHLARPNPVWEALAENPWAVMSVLGAYAYIPTDINAGGNEPEGYGVPTSYYGAVQAIGRCETLDDAGLAAILTDQLAHFQPSGGHEPVEAGDNPYGRQLAAIRGIRMTIEDVRAKFKFGGNKSVDHRLAIADWLSEQSGCLPAEARGQLLRRLKASEPAR